MEKHTQVRDLGKTTLFVVILAAIGGLAFAAGIAWSARSARAEEGSGVTTGAGAAQAPNAAPPKVVYPKSTNLNFEGQNIEGELRNPGEFYFQRRPQEKFDSLVQRRKNFHREMLRDAVLSK